MRNSNWRTLPVLFATLAFLCAGAMQTRATTVGERRSGLGRISGTVLDSQGNPVSGALVKILRDGFNEVVKETKSATDGTFAARVTPGRYLVRALADGFAPATFTSVQVTPATELVYRFNLQPAGEGHTAPELRADRNDPKFRIRAAQVRRSIFNAGDADDATVNKVIDQIAAEEQSAEESGDDEMMASADTVASTDEHRAGRTRTQGYVETFFADSEVPGVGSYAGVNFAVETPVNRQVDLVFAGQAGEFDRVEATARIRAGARHRLSATVGGASLPLAAKNDSDAARARLGFGTARGDSRLGQMSVRAVDEWVVRDGIVVVVGLDYSRFFGAGDAHSLTPRLGFAFDADARTRLHASLAQGTDAGVRSDGVEFEDGQVVFNENAGQAVALVDGQAVLERSHRLEFGVERVLDGSSTVDASAFFDTVNGRGVGLLSTPIEGLNGAGSAALLDIANQQGGAQGLRVVYTRRVGQHIKASAAYAFGRGQRLSPEGLASPDRLFQNTFFQTAAAQLDTSVAEGTTVRTILRFSPRASVFAIDPFAGRLAVYDPSLSILVTQELPNFGLPLRAQATIDARNLLGVLTGVEDSDGNQLTLGALRRSLRGGISVRF
ncbi:MAG TPA: carboxypeptidase-like regulatory domain-containing protein [Pyrinomonadaceae bacterium]|nr:carboxypeptidase-like regulatory domain-containing protein [Pyrinomonadaceae bacterium]